MRWTDPCSSSDVLSCIPLQNDACFKCHVALNVSRFLVLHTYRDGITMPPRAPILPGVAVSATTPGEPCNDLRDPRPRRSVGIWPSSVARYLRIWNLRRVRGPCGHLSTPSKRSRWNDDYRARFGPADESRQGPSGAGVEEERYLVDPASSHMLVSKIKPCMCKYELIQTVKLRMAH